MSSSRVRWDDITVPLKHNHRHSGRNKNNTNTSINSIITEGQDALQKPSDELLSNQLMAIGRKAMTGFLSGLIIGGAIGSIDVLRNVKMMTSSRNVATAKIVRYGYSFGCFFGAYHGLRKAIHTYYPLPAQDNLLIAGLISLSPLVAMASLRPLLPYGIVLVVMDAVNGLNDI